MTSRFPPFSGAVNDYWLDSWVTWQPSESNGKLWGLFLDCESEETWIREKHRIIPNTLIQSIVKNICINKIYKLCNASSSSYAKWAVYQFEVYLFEAILYYIFYCISMSMNNYFSRGICASKHQKRMSELFEEHFHCARSL